MLTAIEFRIFVFFVPFKFSNEKLYLNNPMELHLHWNYTYMYLLIILVGLLVSFPNSRSSYSHIFYSLFLFSYVLWSPNLVILSWLDLKIHTYIHTDNKIWRQMQGGKQAFSVFVWEKDYSFMFFNTVERHVVLISIYFSPKSYINAYLF